MTSWSWRANGWSASATPRRRRPPRRSRSVQRSWTASARGWREETAMPDESVTYFPAERLREFSARVFRHFGVPPADAAQAADVLAASDLRGVDSHGVARLRTYFDLLTLGRINPRPHIR